MITPTTLEILRNVVSTFETSIEPVLTGTSERSAAATLKAMLRHAIARVQDEEHILASDIAALHALIPDLLNFLEAAPTSIDAATAIGVLRGALTQTTKGLESTEHRHAAAGVLREALYVGLDLLQRHRALFSADARYAALRQRIRDYIKTQIEAEAQLIEPAFAGQGPRR